MRLRRVVVVVSVLALRARVARADPPRDDAHAGLMLRAAVGVSYLALRGDGTPLEASGGAFASDVAAGWYVVPNLAVHVTLWSHSAFNPTGTSTTGLATQARLSTPSGTAYGLGLTWVFAPRTYLSASAGVSTLSMEASASDLVVVSRGDLGYAFDVTVGRQLGGSGGWRFGVAVVGSFARNGVTSRGVSDVATTGAGGVVATLTYH